jgi:NADPH-dependent curcumin reductase CurA
LVSRPHGVPTADNFTLVETELEPIEDHHVLVRNLYMSVDPYMRGRMNGNKSYVPPFEFVGLFEGENIGKMVVNPA